jgi:hypothetical protein
MTQIPATVTHRFPSPNRYHLLVERAGSLAELKDTKTYAHRTVWLHARS